MIWGVIPAFFKAHWNTNETLFTLMLNYIATQLVTLLHGVLGEPRAAPTQVGLINHVDQGRLAARVARADAMAGTASSCSR